MRQDRYSILLIGSGGREHALGWKLARSPFARKVFFAGGENAGLEAIAERLPFAVSDHDAVIAACRENAIDLVVIGPEAPLVAGLADDLRIAGVTTFGPSAAASRLEASKGFAKDFCREHDIPTAEYARFDDREAALNHVRAKGTPVVVKADGLAAGKGVTVAETIEDAERAVEACFAGRFGAAGASVVIEEKLDGEEASFFALSDGRTVLPLVNAQDYKRAFDDDAGPNTGGMGAVSPAPVMTNELMAETMERIVRPTIAGMAARGVPFTGILYAGLMITAEGPKLIEYNVRFGDPECQVLMTRLESDLVLLLAAAAEGRLEEETPVWSGDGAVSVVLAARGYPGAYETGSVIRGLDGIDGPDVAVFHAGTARRGGEIVANGGRVLNVTARGATIDEARARAYRAAGAVEWPDGFFRSDIGIRTVRRR